MVEQDYCDVCRELCEPVFNLKAVLRGTTLRACESCLSGPLADEQLGSPGFQKWRRRVTRKQLPTVTLDDVLLDLEAA